VVRGLRFSAPLACLKTASLHQLGVSSSSFIFSLELVENVVRQRIEKAVRNLKLSLHQASCTHDLDGNDRDQLSDRLPRAGDDDFITSFNGFGEFRQLSLRFVVLMGFMPAPRVKLINIS